MPLSEEVYAACSFEQPSPGCVVARLTGELDACSVPAVEEQMSGALQGELDHVVVDLTELEFIDSTGIRMLIQLLRGRGPVTRVALVTPAGGTVRRALEMVGVTQVFHTTTTLTEALNGNGARK